MLFLMILFYLSFANLLHYCKDLLTVMQQINHRKIEIFNSISDCKTKVINIVTTNLWVPCAAPLLAWSSMPQKPPHGTLGWQCCWCQQCEYSVQHVVGSTSTATTGSGNVCGPPHAPSPSGPWTPQCSMSNPCQNSKALEIKQFVHQLIDENLKAGRTT